jgi:hypothetical protein
VSWRSGEQTAELVGRLCAVSRRLHQILGASSHTAEVPALAIALDELSLEHAWHAELLFERLPLRAGYEREEAVQLGELAPALDLLASLGTAGDDVGLLAGYARVVLPRLVLSVAELGHGSSETAERSIKRSARLILSDLTEAAVLSERLAEAVISGEGAVGHAARVVADLEGLLGDRSGLAGP